MNKRTIFNPLAASNVSQSSDVKQEATASMQNTKVGICPKCDENMTRAVIANQDTVFYCEACRVSTPLPDEAVTPLII
jgi:formamidopyrimidine-DNA glycosylase